MPTARVRLTDKQRALLLYVEQYAAEHQKVPSLQEIADQFAVTKTTILQHLRALEKKKVIRRTTYASRMIEIRPEYVTRPLRPRMELPFLGTITAGRPIESFPGADTFDLAAGIETRKDCFVLRVKGNSMEGDHIQEGDYLILEQRDWAKDGELVVAILPSGEATLKRWFQEEGGIRLQPSNPSMEPIRVKEARIHGVVVALVRRAGP